MSAGPLDNLIAALEAEARSQRRNTSSNTPVAQLKDGAAVPGSDGERAYRFSKKSWPGQLMADRPLLIRVGRSGDWHQVDRYEHTDKQVTLSCQADLGSANITAEVREDAAQSCEILIRALHELGDEQSRPALDRAQTLLGTGKPKTGIFARPESVTTDYQHLNAAQQRAVKQALGSELTYVWGPPGTGKTDVVARIVEGYVRLGRRVLFVAPTNVAVDQALERICDLLSPAPAFQDGLVQRLGDIHMPSLRDSYGDSIDRDRLLGKHTEALDHQAQQLRDQQARITKALAARKHIDGLERQLKDKRKQRSAYEQRLQPALAELERTKTVIADLQQQIAEANNHTALRRRLTASKKARWESELALNTDNRARLQQACAEMQTSLGALDRQINDVLAELKRAGAEQMPTRTRLEKQATDTNQALKNVEAQRQRLERNLTQACHVLAMTTQRSYRGRMPLTSVDVVVVDEAGMVELPTVFHLASRAQQSVVLAGDFRQLPAVVSGHTDRNATQQERELVRDWVARDAFHAGGVASETGVNSHDARLVRLDTQYRMRVDICHLVNTVAYPDAPLHTGRSDDTPATGSPLLESSLVLIDTSSHTISGNSAYRNQAHAALIREFVRLLQHDHVLPPRRTSDTAPTDHFAVIAPYHQQVSAIKNQLTERFGASYDGVVDTVHRFQGSQRPLVIVDTVTGANQQLGRFFQESGLDSQTCRLLNVAMSRARDHLVVVANVNHLTSQLAATSEVRVLLKQLKRHAQILSADDLVPVRVADDLRELNETELAKPAFFPADETDKALEWDIARAQTRIEIYCPFMKQGRVQRYRKHLREALARGVTVTIFARDAEQTPENGPLCQQLHDDGCKIVTRDQMHEKVVVVDDVLWFGSLNLFAHTRSTELMMRLTSRSACNSVRSAVERARPTRKRSQPPQTSERPPEGRLYLNVPYEEKNHAKKLGARWDPSRKQWWIDLHKHTPDVFTKWLPEDADLT